MPEVKVDACKTRNTRFFLSLGDAGAEGDGTGEKGEVSQM